MIPAGGLAVVLSGGGERAIACEVGALAGPADGGVAVRDAPAIVGTSAGAVVAAPLAAGADPRADADRIIAAPARVTLGSALDGATAFEALARARETGGGSTVERRRALGRPALERSPGGEDADLAAIARRPPGGGRPPALRVVAIDAERGERIVLDAAAGGRPERAVAASRAVPVPLPPITVARRRCIDGAVGSATNADVLAGSAAARVIVITPVPADPPSGGPERLWLAALREQVATLEATGHRVTVVHASPPEPVAIGPDPLSAATGHLAVAAGRDRGRALALQIRPSRAA